MSQDLLTEDEHEIIAFHLGEPCDESAIRARLQTDEAYAHLSESVSYTLRFFSDEQIAAPDPHAAWQRIRASLPEMHERKTKTRWGWLVLAPAAFAMTVLFAMLVFPTLKHRQSSSDEAAVIHLHPPREDADGTDVSQHLDRAERWLTTVNNASAPLDQTTRAEGEHLLVTNAVYLQQARLQGDLPDAVALKG